jgi:hypothetical protein
MSAMKISGAVALLLLAFALGICAKSNLTPSPKATGAAPEEQNRMAARLSNIEQRLNAAERGAGRLESAPSSPEVARLAGELNRFQQTSAEQNGPASPGARAERAKEHERRLQARVDAERHQEDRQRTADERKRLEVAVRDADTQLGLEGGPSSTHLEEFTCYATLCKGKSSHESDAAFQAFRHAAFGSSEHRMPGWVAVTDVEAAGDRRTAVFYVGLTQPSPK